MCSDRSGPERSRPFTGRRQLQANCMDLLQIPGAPSTACLRTVYNLMIINSMQYVREGGRWHICCVIEHSRKKLTIYLNRFRRPKSAEKG